MPQPSKRKRKTSKKKDKERHPVERVSESDSDTLDTLFALKREKRTTLQVDENPRSLLKPLRACAPVVWRTRNEAGGGREGRMRKKSLVYVFYSSCKCVI